MPILVSGWVAFQSPSTTWARAYSLGPGMTGWGTSYLKEPRESFVHVQGTQLLCGEWVRSLFSKYSMTSRSLRNAGC